jgi:hypothetical protein
MFSMGKSTAGLLVFEVGLWTGFNLTDSEEVGFVELGWSLAWLLCVAVWSEVTMGV